MNQNMLVSEEFKVKGMHCAACAARLEKALFAVPGVQKASVNFASGSANVHFDARTASRPALVLVIKETGFEASRPSESAELEQQEQALELSLGARRWNWAAVGFVPLMFGSMGAHLWPHSIFAAEFPGRAAAEAVLSGAVVFGAGAGILRAAWDALARRGADMNVLIGFGAVLAWFGSVAAWLSGIPSHQGAYFEAAAGIVTFALFGRWLELRNRFKAGAAILEIARLQPGAAKVEVDGAVLPVPVGDVPAGATVRVAPGERIPVDGIILEGKTTVDESWVSGESAPVKKVAGDRVTGATLNGAGALRIKVENAGREAFLSQVLAIVRAAQAGKPPVQRLADKVAGWFSLAVVASALMTGLVWWSFGPEEGRVQAAFWHALAVLVVACPCALGLATPVAVLAATGRGAQMGVLFRNGAVLETLSNVRVIGFDKTGTLTRGKPEVVEWWERKSFEGLLIASVAAAESQSAHPVALAVVAAARELGRSMPEAHEVEAVPGMGIRAEVDGTPLLVGRADWLESCGVVLPETSPEERSGRIWVASGGDFAGWFRVADRVRSEAAHVVAELKKRGVESVLISGDQASVAAGIAAETSIERVFAPVPPVEKLEIVRNLQKTGVTAMVGDGVNDTPALAQADVGFAMGGGTAAARQTADVTLMRDDLRSILDAMDLARATLSVIRQNLALAFGYNILAIPIAAGVFELWMGWAPGPAAASAAMALSSVSVVFNALRLRAFVRVR